MHITFLGAAQTVTGAKYLLTLGGKTFLVDCGLFQGLNELTTLNWNPLPFDPKKINAVVLTHAHIDHSGYLPLLAKNGFKGPIYSTRGTQELCQLLLPDSAHIQEEEAANLNKQLNKKKNKHYPLYTSQDAAEALKLFNAQEYKKPFWLDKETMMELIPAGHIIGSSLVSIVHQQTSILFSGDLGRLHDPMMKAPETVEYADYLIIESTYGDRLHEKDHPKFLLQKIVNQTIQRGGSVIIPAFAVGRSQSILHFLAELKKEEAIPNVPIYLDSPMALSATQILYNHMDELRLTKQQCKELNEVATYIRTVAESINIDAIKTPKIIISASGMVTGGRVLFHLQSYASNPKNTIILTGFQVAGTRGADLLNGIQFIQSHGKKVEILAQVESISSTSAHADYQEILEWLKQFKRPPKTTFITHGEPEASFSLKKIIERELGWNCMVPNYLQTVQLT